MNWKTGTSGVFATMYFLMAIDCLAADDGPRPPALPRVFLETSVASTPVTGRTIQVEAGGDFQAALEKAQPGDEIVLPAGATYTGNFVLPAKSADKWITIRTSNMKDLPQEGTRVSPKDAAAMPKMVDPSGKGALSTALRAGYYRLIGLEITVGPTVENAVALVNLGSGKPEQNNLAVVAHHLILDRVYVHGDPKHELSCCVKLQSASSAIIDSCLCEAHRVDFDPGNQAISGWNGPGPFKIVNNHLEAAGQNVLFGGFADPKVPDVVPSDIEFRYNHCFKPLGWKKDDPNYAGIHWAVRSLFQLECAKRVLIEGNLFENNWPHGDDGTAIRFSPRNGHGKTPWATVQDVTMINNRVRNCQAAFIVMGEASPKPNRGAQRILIRNNLFERIERIGFQIAYGADDVEIDHNTFVPIDDQTFVMRGLKGHDSSGKLVGPPNNPSALPCRRFKLTNNIFGFGRSGPAVGGSQVTFAEAFPGAIWGGNLLVGGAEAKIQQLKKTSGFPAGFLFPPQQSGDAGCRDAGWSAVGFVNYSGGDYRLAESSKYKSAGTDGKPLGVDMDALDAARNKAKP